MPKLQIVADKLHHTAAIRCKYGHTYYGVACDTCATISARELLLSRLERIVSGQGEYMRALGHITTNLEIWDRVRRDLNLRRIEVVPALCGTDLKMTSLRKAKIDTSTGCKCCQQHLDRLKPPLTL